MRVLTCRIITSYNFTEEVPENIMLATSHYYKFIELAALVRTCLSLCLAGCLCARSASVSVLVVFSVSESVS